MRFLGSVLAYGSALAVTASVMATCTWLAATSAWAMRDGWMAFLLDRGLGVDGLVVLAALALWAAGSAMLAVRTGEAVLGLLDGRPRHFRQEG